MASTAIGMDVDTYLSFEFSPHRAEFDAWLSIEGLDKRQVVAISLCDESGHALLLSRLDVAQTVQWNELRYRAELYEAASPFPVHLAIAYDGGE